MAVAAIFDLDGTLVTFKLDIRAWRKVIIDVMSKRGFDTSGIDLSTPTQKILEHAKGQVPTDQTEGYDSLRREAFSILDSLELEGAESASAFPGAEEVLRRLKSRGFRLGLLTNSGRAAASLTLTRWGLQGFFELVLTRDDIEAMKPRPEGLLKAARMLGVQPRHACYVGDSVYDVMAAKAAGMKSIAVATGNYAAERLKDEGADYVIPSLSELPKILGA
jgi:HAD superfamily hydrolase (TIGR01549 family)